MKTLKVYDLLQGDELSHKAMGAVRGGIAASGGFFCGTPPGTRYMPFPFPIALPIEVPGVPGFPIYKGEPIPCPTGLE